MSNTKLARAPSYAAKIYAKLRVSAHSVQELVDHFKPEDGGAYIRVLLMRWMDKEAVVYGPWRDNRRTYTARGVDVKLKFMPEYGQKEKMIVALLKRRPHSVKQLINTLPFSDSGIRNTITRLRDRNEVKVEERGRVLFYSMK